MSIKSKKMKGRNALSYQVRKNAKKKTSEEKYPPVRLIGSPPSSSRGRELVRKFVRRPRAGRTTPGCRPSERSTPVYANGHANGHGTRQQSWVMPTVTSHPNGHAPCQRSWVMPTVMGHANDHGSCQRSWVIPTVTRYANRHGSCQRSWS